MKSTNVKPKTLVIDPIRFQSNSQESSRSSENSNPNVSQKNPKSMHNPTQAVFSPRDHIIERIFVPMNKNSRKEKKDSASVVSEIVCKGGAKTNGNVNKCVCVAYETLRASQEEFFKNPRDLSEVESGESSHNVEEGDEVKVGESDEIWVSSMKRKREKVLEEARRNLPEYGKVMHLVRAFEKLNCFPLSKTTYKENGNQMDNKIKKALKCGLPGIIQQQPPKCPEAKTDQVTWSSSFSPSDFVLTATNLRLEQHHASVSSSCDNIVSSLNTNSGRRSRSNSLDSSASMENRRLMKKQIKATSLKPFKLRTEERARAKEEEFSKKLQEMKMEEEKMKTPIAQGLPWTTNVPESLVKPHVKDITIPIDLNLHSGIRAVERAEFDYQFAEKINLTEQYKAERKRLQKVAEEEDLRRLRKELIPKAQPMPYFDRPFIPKRSNKHPTIPQDPKFNIPRHKKKRCCSTTSSCCELNLA